MNFKWRRAMPGFLALLCLVASSFISMPLPGMGGRINAAAAPDLTISSIVWTPNTPSLEDQMRFTVTVNNQGGDTAGNSRLLFLIDNHTTDYALLSTIPPGGSVEYQFAWKAAAGSHVVKVIADSDQAVAESDENNNEKSYAFSVLAPDLIIGSITWSPEKPSNGDTVAFSVTAQNRGNKIANTQWIDFKIDGASRGQREGQPLNPGASYTRSYNWIAQPGQHILKASVDVLNQSTEGDETNNDLVVVYCTTPPDLTISSINWTPENRSESGNITMAIVLSNAGEGTSNGSWLTCYIDGMPQTSLYVVPLAAGANATEKYNWHPGPDEHIFSATIDEDNWIFERDESNNSRSVTVPAMGLPDLIIQSVTYSPKPPGVDSRLTFTITIKNSGTRTVQKCDFALYITGGTRITRQAGPIAPGGTETFEIQYIIGRLQENVRAVVDEDGKIAESNKTNNEYSFSITPVEPVPTSDLTVQSITCTPSAPAQGDTVTIKTVITNLGTSTAGTSSAACFIDTEFLGYLYVKSLNQGETVEAETHWKATRGVHQVRIIVDPNNAIFEINEKNNEATTTLTTSDPDLAIENIEWFPIYPETGKDVLFTVTVKNQGTRVSSQCFLTYYVNNSQQGEHYIEPIGAGGSVTRNFTWKAQASPFTFKTVIDKANAVVESDKTNNEKSVVLPAPNLTVQNITTSDDYPIAGMLLSFTIDIINNGRSLAGATKTSSYMDGNVLTQVETTELNAGQATKSVFYWTAVPGKHTLRVVVDDGNAVIESSETDNVKEVIIFVPLPSVPLSSENRTDVQSENVTISANTSATVKPTPTDTIPADLLKNINEKTAPDISGNISATPTKASGGVKDILMNKFLIFGIAGVGIAAVLVLLLLRKRGSKEKTPKAPKAPKPPKAAKPAKPEKKKKEQDQKKAVTPGKAPAKMGDTLSGKPAVLVPPPPKPAAKPGASPIKTAPPPLPAPPKPDAPQVTPNLGTTLIKQGGQQPPPPPPGNQPPKV